MDSGFKVWLPTLNVIEPEKVSVADLAKEPMIMLEKGRQAEISNMFEKQHLQANVKFRTFDDYALLSMVENGIAVGVLPKLILERLNYRVEVREIGFFGN
ncbi:MAG: LysR family transcriptional regulator substrate-binding protein [Sutterella seckii]